MTPTRILYALRNWRALWRASKVQIGAAGAQMLGVATFVGTLSVVHIKANGEKIDLGVVARRLVTTAGVGFLVDDWDNDAQNITTMNFHDSGTGAAAEATGDTDLGTPAGPTTRATGTKSQPSANVLRSVGTIAYTSSLAITEHGIFNQATRGGGSVLWDRSVFSAINVANGDSIQFTYDCTCNAGG